MKLFKKETDKHAPRVDRSKWSERLKDAIFYLVGSVLYGISVSMFTSPNNIAPGGITGVSTMLNYAFDIPIGTMMIVLNIPIFILGGLVIGWKYLGSTVFCLVASSVIIDIFDMFLPAYTGDRFVAALFGGVLLGLSLAIIFMRGGSTGGSDIVARVLGRYFRNATQGNIIMAIDLLVISSSVIVYDLESGLYGLIALFVSSFTLDRVLYGMSTGKVMLITSEKAEELSDEIIKTLDRGTTLLQAKGGYSKADRQVIMCAVSNNEVYQLRSTVRSVDPAAFMIVCEASEVLGLGFKPIEQDEFGDSAK